MNCFEFQHHLNTRPQRLPDDAQAHANDCTNCQNKLEQQRLIDTQLAEMLAVPVPAGLADRTLLHNTLRHRPFQPSLAMAATAAIVFIAAGLFLRSMLTTPTLPDLMVQHVLQEPALFQTRESPDNQLIRSSLASIGGIVTQPLPIALAEPCNVPGGEGAHLVFETQAGRTIMTVIPNNSAPDADIRRDNMVSVIHRAPHGIYSLVAQNHTAIEMTRELLNSRVDWQI